MDFNAIKKAVAESAKKAGIEEYEIYYMQDSSVSTETLKGEISNYSSAVSGGVCLRLVVDGKMGYASTELIDTDEMEALVERAIQNAKFVEADDDGVIFAGSPEYGKINAPKPKILDTAHLKNIALSIDKDMKATSDKATEGSSAAMMSTETWVRIFNSYGLDLENHVGFNCAYASAVVNVDGEPATNGEIRMGDKYEDYADLGAKVVNNALEKIGAGKVKTGNYKIVFDKSEMRGLLSAFSSAFSAKSAQMGMSLLAGKEGEKIASDCVTITDDPFRKGYALQTPFDAEGVATYTKNVIEKGVLKTLLHNLATAKKAGVETTGNASKGGYSAPVGISPYCFCIEGSDMTEDELFALAGGGIYVTEMMGLHAGVNATTGDFSLEASGFMIENGKKGRPVKTFTIAGNFFDMLKNVEAVSNEVKVGLGGFTAFGAPNVLVKSLSVAGE